MFFKYILTLLSYLNRIILLDRNVYVVHHGEVSNLEMIYSKMGGKVFISKRNMRARDWSQVFKPEDIVYVKGLYKRLKFFLYLTFSKRIFLNDSCVGLHFISFSKKQKIVQLWHACGAFKKFGLDSLHNSKRKKLNAKMYAKYSLVTVSSESAREAYARSFNLPIEKVMPIGVARTDDFFNKSKEAEIKKTLYSKYPEWEQKKVLLYAPTFRDEEAKKNTYLDLKKLKNTVGNDWVVVVKLHPFDKTKLDFSTLGVHNASLENVNHLMYVTDLLISDYSSLIFEFSLFNKPMIFFAYDLQEYENKIRGFYYNYESFVPGPIAKTEEELFKRIEQNSFDISKIDEFRKKYMNSCDGHSTDRIIEAVK